MGLVLLLAAAPAGLATAACTANAQSCGTQYQVSETFFGSGGELNACGGSYCSKQTAGELGVGKTCTLTYCAQAGFNTDRSPSLEMSVNTPSVDVGVLDTSETHVGTATFQVKSYLASGYQVTTASDPPKNGSYAMNSSGTAGASTVGVEQFGINLVANSCPASAPGSGNGSCSGGLGANPTQDPDSSFSFGQAASGYNTADQYKYSKGDVIAESSSSSGFTLFTVSYLFNISSATPGGTYTMQHSLVATSTY